MLDTDNPITVKINAKVYSKLMQDWQRQLDAGRHHESYESFWRWVNDEHGGKYMFGHRIRFFDPHQATIFLLKYA